jgi:hypothetical protein
MKRIPTKPDGAFSAAGMVIATSILIIKKGLI